MLTEKSRKKYSLYIILWEKMYKFILEFSIAESTLFHHYELQCDTYLFNKLRKIENMHKNLIIEINVKKFRDKISEHIVHIAAFHTVGIQLFNIRLRLQSFILVENS
ncbi:MAG: hypothetical protein DRN53_04195 [Thermoprotei archaeon]|nr:MAG: hypothetical protein DRN53_04195 [Thermoprotei archaeon]